MKIEIRKTTNHQCQYTITRDDLSIDSVSLDTKTYFVHDICHYAVEKHLNYEKGFWGMLAKGYSFGELLGKDNPNTAELRFIEQIVGPVQSAFMGNISKENFALFISHIDFNLDEQVLNDSLAEMDRITKEWQQIPVGENLILEFNTNP